MSAQIHDVLEGLSRIELPGWSSVGSGARTTNVYVTTTGPPALIGAGHPEHSRLLIAALSELDIRASDVARIICASWSPDVVGGHKAFPRADVFVTSPDLVRPRHWDMFSKELRGEFIGLADEIFERVDDWGRAELEPWLDEAFPLVTNHLEFIPIRSGQTIVAGELELEVVAAPGPGPGHALLWNRSGGMLFAGELDPNGLPVRVTQARDYLVGLERAAELDTTWFLPTHGTPSIRGAWTLKRMMRFCNNYLSNVGPTMKGGKTVLELVDADLGHRPEHPAEYIEEVQRRRPFLEELVASRMIKAEGEGLDRRYGIDVEEMRMVLE